MTGAVLGIDVGIASFAVTSDGAHLDNPRWARTAAEQLKRCQQRLAHKQCGSYNRGRARSTVANRHHKVANQRRDFHHKKARKLVATRDVLCVEALVVANMVRRPKPVPDPEHAGVFLPNGASAKAGLNRSIHDASWAAFVDILKAKAEDAGRRVVDVDPRHTSDRCGACGHATKENRVSQAAFVCQRCGRPAHAARNILRAGLARQAAEEPEAA